jgi:predicted AlkP superfamily pyrophosphatase or phosphodiesterase
MKSRKSSHKHPLAITLKTTTIALLSVLLVSCQTTKPEESTPTVGHVVHISIDALGSKYLAKFIQEAPQDFPNFKRLIDEGASTMNARTDYFRTITLPNHTSMITGRPVLTPTNWPSAHGHQLTINYFPVIDKVTQKPRHPTSLHALNKDGENGYTSSTFDVAHDNGLSTALYSTKGKFSIYSVSYGEEFGRPHANGRNKIDDDLTGGNIHAKAMAAMKENNPNYTFLHYGDADGAGHRYGYLGQEYLDAVKLVDGYLGDVLKLAESGVWKDNSVIILSADHGGQPGTTGHGKNDEPYNYTLPFIVWGTGVSQGADLYELNATTRKNPGDGRPEYGPTKQPIRNGDGGNLALKLLGAPAIPGSSINAKQDLRVR